MQKKNIFLKKLNKLVLSISNRIESFFNFFKENFFIKKKRNFKTIDKRIFLVLAVIFIATISYFLLPAFYDKEKIRVQIENQILNKYNLKVKIIDPIGYGVFPKPHFFSDYVILNRQLDEIAVSKDTKILISIKNLFSIKNLKIKDLIFKKTDFRIDYSNFEFFIELLNNIKSSEKINFLNSKLFYLDKNDNIVFLSTIKNLNYLIQDDSLKKLISKFYLFNIPINLDVNYDTLNKSFSTEIKSLPLRLNIKNISNYNNEGLDGDLDLTMINKNIKIAYQLKDKFLKFNSRDNKINGDINIKPFFISLNLDLFNIETKKIFEENSILINILKSETLNNENLNGAITVKSSNFKGISFYDEIKFDIILEEGEVFIQDLTTTFKNSVFINLKDTQLVVDDNNKLKFAGFVSLDFKDIKKFFEHYQINIKDRKYIKKINLAFLFHFDDEFIEIDNLKVDGISNQNLEKFLYNFNLKKENIFNKIVVRNSVKDFFKIISSD